MRNRYAGVTTIAKTADHDVFLLQCAIFENMRIGNRTYFPNDETLIDVDGSILQEYSNGGNTGEDTATVYEDYDSDTTYFKTNFPITTDMIAVIL